VVLLYIAFLPTLKTDLCANTFFTFAAKRRLFGGGGVNVFQITKTGTAAASLAVVVFLWHLWRCSFAFAFLYICGGVPVVAAFLIISAAVFLWWLWHICTAAAVLKTGRRPQRGAGCTTR